MSISVFTNEFQDYLYTKTTLFDSLLPISEASTSDIFVTIEHAKSITEELKTCVDFLQRESDTISEEVDEIFNSLEAKLDKINNYSNALIGLNSVFEDRYSIKDLKPYLLSNSEYWNYTEECVTLPGVSSHSTIKPYQTLDNTEQKGIKTFYFLLPSNITYNGVVIEKQEHSDVTSIEWLDASKTTLKRQNINDNTKAKQLYTDIPLNTSIVIIDITTSDSTETLSISPSLFSFFPSAVQTLEEVQYSNSDYLTFQASASIPLDCYIQLDLQFVFFDINDQLLERKDVKLCLNNNGNLVGNKSNVSSLPEVVYGYRDNTKIYYGSFDEIADSDIVVYTPFQDEKIKAITEDTLKIDIPNASSFSCITSVSFYSLTNNRLTPKLYSLTGITKNDN